jgi:hypothetical protein
MNMPSETTLVLRSLLASAVLLAGFSASAADGDLAPLPLKLPNAAFKGTPENIEFTQYMEKPTGKPRPAFMAPKGVTNVAQGKKVTASDKSPMTGGPELVTDGEKTAMETTVMVMRRGTQWAQIDLGADYNIYAVALWHAHDSPKLYRDVVVQVADDPDFIDGVRTLYNNDFDNSSGLGIGNDKEYFESNEGRLIDGKGAKARYLRCYSRGSTESAFNEYTEIEVWALPAK